MTDMLTPEVIQALLGLATVLATGAFAWYRMKYTEAAEQGDVIMASARKVWEIVKALGAGKPKAAPYLEQGEKIISAMEQGWSDSKVRTPAMEDYYAELLSLAIEVGKAVKE